MKRMKFVISLITPDNDYQIEQAQTAEEMARSLNVDAQIIYAGNDAINQSQQLLTIIQSARELLPSGIIVEPVSGTALPQVATAALKAGIGWVVLNREPAYISQLRKTYKTPLFGVSSDNKMIGQIQGQQLALLIADGGAALYIQGPSDSSVAAQRAAGIYETKGTAIELPLVRGRWTEASAYKTIESWLRLSTSRQRYIQVIAAQNDAMAMGARRAFNELSKGSEQQHWLEMPYLGVDGVQTAGLAWVKKGLLRATVIVPSNARMAVYMLARALETGVAPPELTTIEPIGFPEIKDLSTGHARPRSFAKHA